MRPSLLRIMHRAVDFPPLTSPSKSIRIKRSYQPAIQNDARFDFDQIFEHKSGFIGTIKRRPTGKIIDRLQW